MRINLGGNLFLSFCIAWWYGHCWLHFPISSSVSFFPPTLDLSATPRLFSFLSFRLSSLVWFDLQGCFKRPKATEFCAGSVLGYNDQLYDVRDEQGDYLV